MSSSFYLRIAPILYILIFFIGFFTACVWFNPQDYWANLAPTLMAIAVVALVWLVYVFLMHKSKLQAELHRREKLIQQERVHPVLHAALQSVESQPEMLVLVVKNHGKGLAKQVKFRVEALAEHVGSKAVALEIEKLPVFSEQLDVLASGEIYGGVFADVNDLLVKVPDGVFSGVVKLSIECQNTFDEVCTSESILDLTMLNYQQETVVKPRKKLLY